LRGFLIVGTDVDERRNWFDCKNEKEAVGIMKLSWMQRRAVYWIWLLQALQKWRPVFNK